MDIQQELAKSNTVDELYAAIHDALDWVRFHKRSKRERFVIEDGDDNIWLHQYAYAVVHETDIESFVVGACSDRDIAKMILKRERERHRKDCDDEIANYQALHSALCKKLSDVRAAVNQIVSAPTAVDELDDESAPHFSQSGGRSGARV